MGSACVRGRISVHMEKNLKESIGLSPVPYADKEFKRNRVFSFFFSLQQQPTTKKSIKEHVDK